LFQLLRQAGKLPWIAVRGHARVHEGTFGPQRTDSIDLCQTALPFWPYGAVGGARCLASMAALAAWPRLAALAPWRPSNGLGRG
jgi:hypothetical protein